MPSDHALIRRRTARVPSFPDKPRFSLALLAALALAGFTGRPARAVPERSWVTPQTAMSPAAETLPETPAPEATPMSAENPSAAKTPFPTPLPVQPAPPLPADDLAALSPEQRTLRDCYKLNASIPCDYPGMDLVLLTSRAPLPLNAKLVTKHEPGDGWVEKSRKIVWSADFGTVADSTPGAVMAEGRATFTPPDASECVVLTAVCDLEFRRIKPGGDFEYETARITQALRVLTQEPGSNLVGGKINGYDIGEYPAERKPRATPGADKPGETVVHGTEGEGHATAPTKKPTSEWPSLHPDRYRPPEAYYKIESWMKDLLIAPHQKLGMWAIDFPWFTLGMPQYVALDWNLVRKLEDLIELMKADGRKITRFVPIYGFRPPSFNQETIVTQKKTNLKVVFSMHQFGRAADIIVDEDGDGVMDDLNGDGVSDIHDAAVVMHYVNQLDQQYRREGRTEMIGGAGLYTSHDFIQRPAQSPYIHVDTRGFTGNGGGLIRWTAGEGIAQDSLWPDGRAVRFSLLDRRGFETGPPPRAIKHPPPLTPAPLSSGQTPPAPQVTPEPTPQYNEHMGESGHAINVTPEVAPPPAVAPQTPPPPRATPRSVAPATIPDWQ